MSKIKKLKNKNEQVVFDTILSTFIHIDKEPLAYMKYMSKRYASFIGFSYINKILFL